LANAILFYLCGIVRKVSVVRVTKVVLVEKLLSTTITIF
jgi:hypothetical protein